MNADPVGPSPTPLSSVRLAALTEVLEEARSWGFLGPGLVHVHLEHALGFAAAVGDEPGSLADLGSGGGVPGLVLAEFWTETRVLLVEANQRRSEFLRRSVEALGLESRVTVVHERAEVVGRIREYRHAYSVVTARGFGPPAVTAECAAGLVGLGGCLVVSEPPGGDADRWDPIGVERLGFGVPTIVADGAAFAVMARTALVEEYPRRAPAKRPLW